MRTALRILAAVVLLAIFLALGTTRHFRPSVLQLSLAKTVLPTDQRRIPCPDLLNRQPFVLLALGQSNAGNHGTVPASVRPAPIAEPIALVYQGECMLAVDPLPGSTGKGGSIWSHLSQRLLHQSPQRLWVLSVMGIDATTVRDWTQANSPLRERLVDQVRRLVAMGLPPNLILWQQGEADARTGTSEEAYANALQSLASLLSQAGTDAPILLARSTVCGSQPYAGVRAAIASTTQTNNRFRLGPDTDLLTGAALRPDGCHFSAPGLHAAAQAWANTIAPLAAAID